MSLCNRWYAHICILTHWNTGIIKKYVIFYMTLLLWNRERKTNSVSCIIFDNISSNYAPTFMLQIVITVPWYMKFLSYMAPTKRILFTESFKENSERWVKGIRLAIELDLHFQSGFLIMTLYEVELSCCQIVSPFKRTIFRI